MKKRITIYCFLLALAISVFAERGRVKMEHGTVVTDQGRNLRGAFISLDWWNTYQLPSDTRQRIFDAVNVYGLNTVHVYLEKFDSPTGCNAQMADDIVNWTGEANMYCVITIGCGSNNGSFNLSQATAFWNFYAGRYANRTHVVYEIHNEPENECNTPMSSATIDLEWQCYEIIRSKAPNTHIMAFTSSSVAHTSCILTDIDNLKARGASFSNMSIAYHGYYWCVQARDGMGYANNTEALALDPIIAAGYSVISTEFEDNNTLVGDITKNGQLLKFYESRNTSWLCFFNILGGGNYNIDGSFKTGVNNMGLTWTPDYGTWPSNSNNSDSQVPSTPSGLASSNITTTSFTLSWSASTDNIGVASYEIFQGGTFKGISTTTSFNVTGLTASTAYDMTVKAKDAAGNTSVSSTAKSVITGAPTSIVDIAKESDIIIYPNPATTKITVVTANENAVITVIGIDGTVVSKIKAETQTATIDVSNWTKGLYLLYIQTNNNTVVKKVIVE